MADSHTHQFAAADWPFADPPNATAIMTEHVLDGTLPVEFVAQHADDGMWQVLCSTANDPKDGCVVGLGCRFE